MSGRLKISPGGPGVSMKNMLASIPFDPYNTPKSFPSGGGGGGQKGDKGDPGEPGTPGPPSPVATAGCWFPIHFWRSRLDDGPYYQVIVNQQDGWDHYFEFTTTVNMKIRAMMTAAGEYPYAEGNDDPCLVSASIWSNQWDNYAEWWAGEGPLGWGYALINSDPNIHNTASVGPTELWSSFTDYDPENTPPDPVTPDELYVVPGKYQVRFRLGITELPYHGGENWNAQVMCAIDGALLGT